MGGVQTASGAAEGRPALPDLSASIPNGRTRYCDASCTQSKKWVTVLDFYRGVSGLSGMKLRRRGGPKDAGASVPAEVMATELRRREDGERRQPWGE